VSDPWVTTITREIVPTVDGFQRWRQNVHIWGTKAQDAPRLSLVGAGRLTVTLEQETTQTPNPGRIYVTEVMFLESLPRGVSHSFTLQRLYNMDIMRSKEMNNIVHLGVYNLNTPTDRMVIEVSFPPQHRPSTLWRYTDLPHFLIDADADNGDVLHPDAEGYVSATWEHPAVGYCSGIAWRW
jgi:hypothetical protein